MTQTIETKVVFVKAHDGQEFEVAGDNASIIVNGTEPFSGDTKRQAIEKVAAQSEIVVKRPGFNSTFVWSGPYAALIVR